MISNPIKSQEETPSISGTASAYEGNRREIYIQRNSDQQVVTYDRDMDPNQLYRLQISQASLAVKENQTSSYPDMNTPMLAQGIGEEGTERIECTETVNILDRNQYFQDLAADENPTPGSELHIG